MAGDWNQELGHAWLSCFFGLLGLQAYPTAEPTRWEGERLIDYFVAKEEVLRQPCLRTEHVSDHIIAELHMRIQKRKIHSKPGWLSDDQWPNLFDASYAHGEQLPWQEAWYEMNRRFHEEAEKESEQAMIDYLWRLAMMKAIWCFKKAIWCFKQADTLSLFEMPEGYDDWREIAGTENFANHWRWRRLQTPKRLERKFPRCFDARSVKQSGMRNLLGRWKALLRHLQTGCDEMQTRNLIKKIFGRDAERPTEDEMRRKIYKLEEDLERTEKEDNDKNLGNWRTKMKEGPARS